MRKMAGIIGVGAGFVAFTRGLSMCQDGLSMGMPMIAVGLVAYFASLFGLLRV